MDTKWINWGRGLEGAVFTGLGNLGAFATADAFLHAFKTPTAMLEMVLAGTAVSTVAYMKNNPPPFFPEAQKLKLGKLAPRHDDRTLRLAKYLSVDELPPNPVSVNWGTKVPAWGMMKNDEIGDCTAAASCHLIELWTANTGDTIILPDDQVVAGYSAITGYNPATGANDNGAVEIDVLNYWRSTGFGGHKISAYASVDTKDIEHVKAAINLFGGVFIGVALPRSAQGQSVWSVPFYGPIFDGAPGSWGGHAVPVIGYDTQGLLVVTWGQVVRMTWAFWKAYCEESYAIISPDWFDKAGVDPTGLDLTSLQKDLANITTS